MPGSKTISPLLYQINIRVYLTELSQTLGKPATLDDFPEDELSRLADLGFEWIWLLSVWQTGTRGQEISRGHEPWLHEFRETLPDLDVQDIDGSGFAVTQYAVAKKLGGDLALERLRTRMAEHKLKLMLDFVPNHTAIDHPWVQTHPEYFVHGSEDLHQQQPQNYIKVNIKDKETVLAHGRDPYFPGWPDTLQLDYSNAGLQQAMIEELVSISDKCDGVRCDMAMLILPEVFSKTWDKTIASFWPATIKRVHARNRSFVLMAEVYWDLEWRLQHEGFDYTYDKRLYDRLRNDSPRAIREHLMADTAYQRRSVRFLENHDEHRAVVEFKEKYGAAAIITYFVEGLRFFHQGQLEGKEKRVSPHLIRGPRELCNEQVQNFYQKLLSILKQRFFHFGRWTLLTPYPAWEGNPTHDHYVCFLYEGKPNERALVVVNYAETHSQCYLPLPNSFAGSQWRLTDYFSGVEYERNGNELGSKGLFLDEGAWKYYVFDVKKI